jgi:hypothetical protein
MRRVFAAVVQLVGMFAPALAAEVTWERHPGGRIAQIFIEGTIVQGDEQRFHETAREKSSSAIWH